MLSVNFVVVVVVIVVALGVSCTLTSRTVMAALSFTTPSSMATGESVPVVMFH